MSPFYLGLIIGLFLGTWIGMFVLAMCVVAKRTDQMGGLEDEPGDW